MFEEIRVKRLLLLPMLLAAGALQAQNIIVFTAETTTGTEVVTPVLTWSTSPPADGCDASGSWTGAKGPSGTETLPDITTGATYNLTCHWLDDKATLTWTAPTVNTDGTPLVDLNGFALFRGLVPGGPYDDAGAGGIDIPDETQTTFVDQPLLPGQYCYVVQAYNALDVHSDNSNEACKNVDATSDVQSVGIVVNPKPNVPAGLGVT